MFEVDSAGTSAEHAGDPPDPRTVQTCLANGIRVDHRARQLRQSDFDTFDFIFCMDNSNLRNVMRIRPKSAKSEVRMFGEFDPNGQIAIEDPYYGSLDAFALNFAQAMRCSAAFLDSLGFK